MCELVGGEARLYAVIKITLQSQTSLILLKGQKVVYIGRSCMGRGEEGVHV